MELLVAQKYNQRHAFRVPFVVSFFRTFLVPRWEQIKKYDQRPRLVDLWTSLVPRLLSWGRRETSREHVSFQRVSFSLFACFESFGDL